MDYAEALRARCAELRRRAHDQRQMQDRVNQDIEACEQETTELRGKALQLQLKAEEQRQASKQLRSVKKDAPTLKKEVEHREHQIKILTEDLAKHESETSKLVDVALSEALQAASTRELHLELQWKAELETDLRRLRDTEAESRRLEKELKQLEEQLQRFPYRTALVQIFAVLDEWRGNKKAAERRQHFQQMQMELMKSWDRRIAEHQQQLVTLDAAAAQRRLDLAQGLRLAEEEAAQEEKELRERLARNQRRAHRAEGEFSKYKAEVAKAATKRDDQDEGLEMANGRNGLPSLERHMPRSALSEFSVAGALKALDQEGNDRFGLLRPR
eukprot:s161_g17.t1